MYEISDELLSAIRLRVRRTRSGALDEDLKQLAAAALDDLARIGVKEEYLADCSEPLIKEAVLTFVNANFGISSDSEKLMQAYNTICVKIKGSGYI